MIGQQRTRNPDERKRRITLEALRDQLADLAGFRVGRVALRAGRMVVWLCEGDRPEPTLAIKLLGVVAFRDGGIAAAPLSRGTVGEVGAWGKAIAEAEGKPEILGYYQMDLCNADSPKTPRLQAVARDIRVYQGVVLKSPDRIWTA